MYDGMNNQYIVFTATDSKGQSTQVIEQVFVEKSPYLKQVFAGNDQIFDFNNNEALISNYWWQGSGNTPDLNPYSFRTRIVNVLTGDSTPVLYSGPIVAGLGGCHLTPFGAIMSVVDSATGSYSFVDWNAGSLYLLFRLGQCRWVMWPVTMLPGQTIRLLISGTFKRLLTR